MLIAHPEWTNKRIAEEVGCHPKTLSRPGSFREARKAIKGADCRLPRGSKNGETGDIEAWDD